LGLLGIIETVYSQNDSFPTRSAMGLPDDQQFSFVRIGQAEADITAKDDEEIEHIGAVGVSPDHALTDKKVTVSNPADPSKEELPDYSLDNLPPITIRQKIIVILCLLAMAVMLVYFLNYYGIVHLPW
jgi:hypothetical protein